MMSLVLLPMAASAADRWGRVTVIVPSLLIMAASLAVIGLAATTAVFVIGGLCLGFGNAVSGPAPAAYAAEVSSSEARGMAMGAFRTAGDLGLLLGPPVLGVVADSVGFSAAYIINAVIVAVSGLTLWIVVRFGRSLSHAG